MNHYRVLQEAAARTSFYSVPALQAPVTLYYDKTVNFAKDNYTIGTSPFPSITRSQFLEQSPLDTTNPVLPYSWINACTPECENAIGYADLTNMNGVAHSTAPNQVKTTLNGYARDPLEPSFPGMATGVIQWGLSVNVDTSKNNVTIDGTNTCYPAHQIWINNVLVYDSQPDRNTTAYLSSCLTYKNPKTVSSCTVFLNTTSPVNRSNQE